MKRNTRGFTLIEVLIAMIIMTGAIMVIANAWSGNFMRMRKSSLLNNVATLLERKIVEIESLYKIRSFNEIPAEQSGDFGSDFPQYRWAMKSRDLELPDLSALIVGQDGEADQTLLSMVKQMTETLNRSIKEVKVSVFVKSRQKELEFSATQYFINFQQGGAGIPGLPGGGGVGGAGGGNGNGAGNGVNQ